MSERSSPRIGRIFTFLVFISVVAAGTYYGYTKLFRTAPAEATTVAAAPPQGPPPATVAVAQAVENLFEPVMELPGTVQSLVDATVAAETRGKIISVIQVGDYVQQGDTIARIDPTDARETLQQRQAELARLESQYDYHAGVYAIVANEEDDLGLSGIGVAELKSNMDSAHADLERGRVSVRLAETDLARTTIRAPFSGTVVSQEIQPGEYAQAGSPIVRLVDTVHLEVSVQVPAASVVDIVEDQLLPVIGKRDGYDARFRTLVPVGDAVSRTMELRADVSGSGMMVGEPVRVRIPIARPRTSVAVPRDAIVLRANSQFLFVIRDDVAVRETVETGVSQGDLVEVVGILDAGEMVVTRGAERLRDGQPVNIINSNASIDADVSSAL